MEQHYFANNDGGDRGSVGAGRTVRALSPEELRQFRDWLDAWDAERWDRQFAADALGGKLDAIADRALKDLAENRATDL